MHVYVYDDYLNKSKYSRVINRVEIRLTDLGLNGKIIRLSGIKNIKATIQAEIRLGAKTIVAVGNNQTINKILGALINDDLYGNFQKETLLGIIPIGEDNSIATSFGIKTPEEACNILLARRVEKIDLGLAGNHYFLNEASIQSQGTTLKIENYSIETAEKGEINIINLHKDREEKIKSNPHDGLLDIVIKTKKKDRTYFNSPSFEISNPQEKLIVDGLVEIDTPAKIGVLKDCLNIIVGKDRLFE
jgi:hypothetical protein